jgi:hypothetical protein
MGSGGSVSAGFLVVVVTVVVVVTGGADVRGAVVTSVVREGVSDGVETTGVV